MRVVGEGGRWEDGCSREGKEGGLEGCVWEGEVGGMFGCEGEEEGGVSKVLI